MSSPARKARLDDLLARVKQSTVKREQLLKEVHNVPPAVAMALITQRPELVRAAPAEALTVEQAKDLYDLIATLIETNHALQQHAIQVSELVREWVGHISGVAVSAQDIKRFADFENPFA